MLAPNKDPEQSSFDIGKFATDWAPTFWAGLLGLVLGDITSADSLLVKREKSAPITTLKQPAPEVHSRISKSNAPNEIAEFIKTNPSLEIIKLADDLNDPGKILLCAVERHQDGSEMKMMLAPDSFELPRSIYDQITASYRLPEAGHTIILYRTNNP